MTETPPALSAVLGGELGRHARPGGRWSNPAPWTYLALTLSWLFLGLRQLPCVKSSDMFPNMCYSDIPVLYYWRGLQEGKIPYLQTDIEYPVLTGAFMELSRLLVVLLGGKSEPGLSSAQVTYSAGLFFGVTIVVLFALFVLLVWTHLQFHRPWDALMIAIAPAVWTSALINWDGLVVALTALAMLAWARRAPVWTGIWLGLGVAAKLYPVLLLVPLAVLCLRTGKWRAFLVTLGATVASWVAMNLPVYLATPSGWLNFWTFNVDRGGDLGSIWYVLSLAGYQLSAVSRLEAAAMIAGTAVIALVLLLAPRRPRFAQGAFLIVALFLMVNKVYSPQYVLWLLPLLVLARPRWLDWSVFSVAEAFYFMAIWAHLDGRSAAGNGDDRMYWLAVLLRIAVQAWLCVRVALDMLRPERDVVRAGGLDDPDGGLFDRAPDASWLTWPNRQPASR